MNVLPEDIITCESCSCNIVCGDEYDNGLEALCSKCYRLDQEADKKASELMKKQFAQGA